MQGIRFYEELHDKGRKGERSEGTVLVVDLATRRVERMSDGRVDTVYDAVGGVVIGENAPVATTSVAATYLRVSCRRVSEARARTIHPAAFGFLNSSL